MKDRLKKKLKAKKILGDKGRSFDAKPKEVQRKVYEMPEDYKKNLRFLTEMLDEQAEYEKTISKLPPEKRAEAMPHLLEYKKNLEILEQELAVEYEDFQNRQFQNETAQQKKMWAGARLQEKLERMFIVAKHKFSPEDFKAFSSRTLNSMSFEDRENFYDMIAVRESYDLENILANPATLIRKPMKNPWLQHKEALFEINRLVYETDKSFKKMYKIFEKALADRNEADENLWAYPPEQREKQRLKIEELDRQMEEVKYKLMEYLEMCFAEDGKVEVKKPDQKKLDAAFDQAEIVSERLYIVVKHTTPHLLEKFEQQVYVNYTPEEMDEFRTRIAEREEKELDEILESVGQKKK